MTKIRLALVLLALTTVQACTHSKVSSVRNPFGPGRTYSNILVAFPVGDTAMRRSFEDDFARRSTPGRTFVASHTVLGPEEERSAAALQSALADHRIDAVLVVSHLESGIEPGGRGLSGTPECAIYDPGTECLPRMLASAALDPAESWMNFVMTLSDTETGVVVWRADSESRGLAFTRDDELLSSLIAETVKKLEKDGKVLLTPSP